MSYSGAIWRVTINLKDMLLHGLKRVLKIFIHHNSPQFPTANTFSRSPLHCSRLTRQHGGEQSGLVTLTFDL